MAFGGVGGDGDRGGFWGWQRLPSVPTDPRLWALCLGDVRWLRNQVVAPLTEELVFRACMLPMLVPCTGPGPAVLACPLFFGVGEHGGTPPRGPPPPQIPSVPPP